MEQELITELKHINENLERIAIALEAEQMTAAGVPLKMLGTDELEGWAEWYQKIDWLNKNKVTCADSTADIEKGWTDDEHH